jgi:WD40 repeat protein
LRENETIAQPAEDSAATETYDAFVSYSREDQVFVKRLTEALAARGKRSWVDWADIPPTAEWMAEIREAIDAADTYVVVLSPASIASKVCAAELDGAMAANKRIVPILAREVAEGTVPDALARLNWVVFTDADFDGAVRKLVEALETDLDHVKGHTRLLLRAREWESKGEDKALLVRGRELAEAETWLAQASSKDPAPTPGQTRFLLAARRAATRRQRGAISAVTAAFVLTAALGVFAWTQRSAAIESQRLAVERARQSRSRELAAASVGQLEVDPELSLLLANEAMDSARTSEAVETLRLSLSESRIRETFAGHDRSVVAVGYSSDGERLLSGSYDGTARIWQVRSPNDPLVLDGHRDLIEAAEFSPDGSLVVTASFDGTAKVWDASTGDELATLRGHRSAVHDASFSSDGNLIVTAGHDSTARVWGARTGEHRLTLRGHTRAIYDASFSPSGRLIVSASDDDTARVWDARTGRSLHVLEGHRDGLYTASFDSEGERVATASEDETARVWDATSGRLLADLVGSRGPVVSASFGPDGSTVLTASEDSTARIWDASSGRQVVVLRGHQDEVGAASFSNDGSLLVTASLDGTSRIWNVADGTTAAVLRGHAGGVLSATFSPDGDRVATGGTDGTARLWDPLAGEVLFEGEVSNVWGEPGGSRIAISTWDGAIHVMDSEKGRELYDIAVGAPQTGAEFSADGTLIASGGLDGVGRVWDSESGELVTELRGHEPGFMFAGFFDGSDQVLTWSEDGTARLWDPRSGEELVLFEHGRPEAGGGIWEAHLSSDGTRVFTTGFSDGVVRMWDTATGQELWSVDGLLRTGGIGGAFAPDGSLVGSVSAEATIWDAETGRKVATLEDPGQIRGVVFSPDSETVATRSTDGAARIWDPRTGELLAQMTGHPSTVNSAWFSQDGRWLATMVDDGTVRVFDVASGELVAIYGEGGGPGVFAFFSSDDRAILSWNEQAVRIDRCDACGTPGEMLDLSESRLTRSLTPEERMQYLGESPGDVDASSRPEEGLTGVNGRPISDGLLPPGEYRAVGFDPPLSFTVQEGWYAQTFLDWAKEGQTQVAVVVQLQQADRPTDGLAFYMLDPGRAIDGRKEWDERRNIEPFPSNLPGWLKDHPNLQATRVRPVTVGGVDGVSVDTLVTSVPQNSWPNCGECVTPFTFGLQNETGPMTDEDLVNVLPLDELDRWIVLDTGESTILVNAFSSTRKGFRDFMPIVDRLLETVTIGG